MCATVSIIIPIYNAEKYLAECLGNVVNQTLGDIEIILVNDASTDNSMSIIRDCKEQYPDKVLVIDSEENRGAGGARNLGLEVCSGEYVGFVDSDDIIDVTMYMAILHISDEQTGILTEEKRKHIIVGGGYIVSKLFRRGLFEDEQLRFRRNVILEDADFLTYLYGTIHSIGVVKEVLYCYRNHTDSSSNLIATDKYYDNICKAIKMIQIPNYPQLREAVEYELLQMYSYGVNICLKAYMESSDWDCKKKLEAIAGLKKKVVAGGYGNPYVQAKIGQLDIAIMQMNDESQEKLLFWVRQQMGGKWFE